MATRQSRKKAPVKKAEPTKPEVKEPVKVAEPASTKGPTTVTVVMTSTHPLTHPCGTTCMPNNGVELPDDGWVKAQEKAGLIQVTRK